VGVQVRRAAKRDLAEKAIVDALEAAGALVVRLNWPVDLAVRYRHQTRFMEVKTGKHLRADQDAQRAFCRLWEVPYVRTPEEALIVIGAIRAPQEKASSEATTH
jgi:hypothetical protein